MWSCALHVLGACTVFRSLYTRDDIEVLMYMQAKLVPKGYLFATLISACERNGDWERAIALFETMKVSLMSAVCNTPRFFVDACC